MNRSHSISHPVCMETIQGVAVKACAMSTCQENWRCSAENITTASRFAKINEKAANRMKANRSPRVQGGSRSGGGTGSESLGGGGGARRSEEHTSELQSL